MNNSNNNRPHLVYMTGISVNKKYLNEIAENINFDKDYTYWLKEVQDELNNSISTLSRLLGATERITQSQVEILIDTMTDLSDVFTIFDNNILEQQFDSNINLLNDKLIKKPIKSIFSKVFKSIDYVDNEGFKNITNLKKLFNQQSESLNYRNADFFSLYLSNQSDSIGLIPLAQISNEKDFKFMNTYCDWDFFDNKYIDHIVLKIDSNFSDGIEVDDIEDIFKTHLREIIISKSLYNTFEEEKQDTVVKSIFEELTNSSRYSTKDILTMLGERNFFGISLLSMILYFLSTKITNKENIDIKTNENNIIGIKINENNTNEKEFLKELLSYSFDPNRFSFSDENNSPISAKIYFSTGVELTKNIDELINDKYFLNTNNYSYSGNRNDKLPLINEPDESFKKEKILEYNINTVDFDNKDNLFTYVKKLDNGDIYIKIPIKIILSLPIEEQKQVNSELFIPDCINNKEKEVIDIITVGGAEHNRALAHLINKHRLKYKDERIYGFMDNYFDMIRKEELDSHKIQNSTSFFMGINQPVSGWNYVMLSREDNDVGESINSDVKLLTFKLKNNKQRFNILSIYGFSAIASVLGINLIIQEIKEKNSIESELFNKVFSRYFEQDQIEEELGTSSAVYFNPKPKDIIMKKVENMCYQYIFNYDINKFKKLFTNNKKESEIIKDITRTKLQGKNSEK